MAAPGGARTAVAVDLVVLRCSSGAATYRVRAAKVRMFKARRAPSRCGIKKLEERVVLDVGEFFADALTMKTCYILCPCRDADHPCTSEVAYVSIPRYLARDIVTPRCRIALKLVHWCLRLRRCVCVVRVAAALEHYKNLSRMVTDITEDRLPGPFAFQ